MVFLGITTQVGVGRQGPGGGRVPIGSSYVVLQTLHVVGGADPQQLSLLLLKQEKTEADVAPCCRKGWRRKSKATLCVCTFIFQLILMASVLDLFVESFGQSNNVLYLGYNC